MHSSENKKKERENEWNRTKNEQTVQGSHLISICLEMEPAKKKSGVYTQVTNDPTTDVENK